MLLTLKGLTRTEKNGPKTQIMLYKQYNTLNIQHQESVYGFIELLVLQIHHFPVPLSKQCMHTICQSATVGR